MTTHGSNRAWGLWRRRSKLKGLTKWWSSYLRYCLERSDAKSALFLAHTPCFATTHFSSPWERRYGISFHPEFVLFGVDHEAAAAKAEKFYRTLHHAIFYKTSIESAELIKVAYNTFISTKISFVNVLMEMCHKLPGTNVDDVTNALKLGTRRIISDAYLSAGMGDGGGCHPRDNIALSWLAKKLDLSTDWFESIMLQRERHTDWLVDLIEEHKGPDDKVYVLGKSFKPETNIQTGSPSILLKNILTERGIDVTMWDPRVDKGTPQFTKGVYFVGTKHPEFVEFAYPEVPLC